MAFRSSTLVAAMLSLLLVAGSSPRAQGLILDGLLISSANIGGVLYCVNQVLKVGDTAGVAVGVAVDLKCGSGTVVKSTTTDVTGKYFFAFSLLDALLFDPTNCYVEAQINNAQCTLPVPTAVLRAPILVLSVVQSLLGGLLGNLLTCATGPLSWVA